MKKLIFTLCMLPLLGFGASSNSKIALEYFYLLAEYSSQGEIPDVKVLLEGGPRAGRCFLSNGTVRGSVFKITSVLEEFDYGPIGSYSPKYFFDYSTSLTLNIFDELTNLPEFGPWGSYDPESGNVARESGVKFADLRVFNNYLILDTNMSTMRCYYFSPGYEPQNNINNNY